MTQYGGRVTTGGGGVTACTGGAMTGADNPFGPSVPRSEVPGWAITADLEVLEAAGDLVSLP